MSNLPIKALVKYCFEQGMTSEIVENLTDEELAQLPGPDGEQLNTKQIMMLRTHSQQPPIEVKSSLATTITEPSKSGTQTLLEFCSEQGLTPDMINELTDEELAKLPGPDGNLLTTNQIMMLRDHPDEHPSDVRPSRATTRIGPPQRAVLKCCSEQGVTPESVKYRTMGEPAELPGPSRRPLNVNRKLVLRAHSHKPPFHVKSSPATIETESAKRAVETLLKFSYEQGLTMDIINELTDEELAALPGPDGEPLNTKQIMMLRHHSNLPHTDMKPSPAPEIRTNLRLGEKDREIERLKKERDQLRALAAKNRQVGSESYGDQIRDDPERIVCQIVSDLTSLGSNLDICFCIDARCIIYAKQCIVAVTSRISASTGMSARFALVVYRDYCDRINRHQIWNFGSNSDIVSHLATVYATGGGDIPQDCFGGICAAMTRTTWRAPAKAIIWIGDAPQHGTVYNGGMIDAYPRGDPEGRTAIDIFRELKKRRIVLMFGKLNDSTDAMCKRLRTEVAPSDSGLFREYYIGMAAFLAKRIHKLVMPIQTHDIKAVEKPYTLTPVNGIKVVEMPYTLTPASDIIVVEKPYTLTQATWSKDEQWGPEEKGEVLKFAKYPGKDLRLLLDFLVSDPDTSKYEVPCRMTLHPVERGEMRYAFYCKLIGSKWFFGWTNAKCIAKESRYEGFHNTKQTLIGQANIQAVASFLATAFSIELKRRNVKKELLYMPVQLLYVPSRPAGKRYFSLEPFIPGKYKKFNNNNGFVDKSLEASHPVLQTFSHFTYSYSRGMVMVVDLQGTVDGTTYQLTDPAIHTADPKKCLIDPTNLGPEGMSAFFSTHVCNDICRLLELERPEGIPRMISDESHITSRFY